MSSRLRALPALGATALALVACSPSAAGPSPVSASTAPTVEPSPGATFATPTPPKTEPTPPPTPTEIAEHSMSGSRAAIDYYVALYGYAKQTGRLAELRSSFASTCTTCQEVVNDIERTYGAGGSITGDVPVVLDARFLPEHSATDSHAWMVDSEATDVEYRDADGTVTSTGTGGRARFVIFAVWGGTQWIVEKFVSVEQDS